LKPFLLVGIFKYITTQFNVNLSASIYLWGFCFFKQLSAIGMSYAAGMMYVTYGFKTSYLILGCTALLFTIISAFARAVSTAATGHPEHVVIEYKRRIRIGSATLTVYVGSNIS
jgi:OHS family lactose permease-like MFS transporter